MGSCRHGKERHGVIVWRVEGIMAGWTRIERAEAVDESYLGFWVDGRKVGAIGGSWVKGKLQNQRFIVRRNRWHPGHGPV